MRLFASTWKFSLFLFHLASFHFQLIWIHSDAYHLTVIGDIAYKNVKEAQADLYNLDLRRKPPNHILDPFFPDNINIADCVLQGTPSAACIPMHMSITRQ